MTELADLRAPLRQVLAHGRLSDAVTGLAVEAEDVELHWHAAGGTGAASGVLPTRLGRRAGGWFALQLAPEVAMPDLTGPGTVTLTARIVVSGRDAVEVSRDVPAADLTLENATVIVGGIPLNARRVRGASVDFSAVVPPRPVALRGIVLRAHDPADPIAGASVAVAGAPTVQTDDRGRFAVDTLPVAAALDVTVSHGGEEVTVVVRPDHTSPVNHLTVSLPG